MNVAIIGASGIGKHHAKWFHLAGCDVVAFSGTSPESCHNTGTALQKLFDFRGGAYTDYRRMFESESIDIVSICSPPETHLEQVRDALNAGCHVYCEKPFAWPAFDAIPFPLPPRASHQAGVMHPVLRGALDETAAVIALADQSRRVLGMNAQYVAAQTAYNTLYDANHAATDAIETFYFLLESKGVSGKNADNEGIWIDMSPHALSQIIAWMPDGDLDRTSIDCRIREHETVARFRYGTASVEVILRKNPDPTPRRQFGMNGFLVEYEGRVDEQGRFRSYFQHGDTSMVTDDLVQISIRRFLDVVQGRADKPFVDGPAIMRNLEMSMTILEYGNRV